MPSNHTVEFARIFLLPQCNAPTLRPSLATVDVLSVSLGNNMRENDIYPLLAFIAPTLRAHLDLTPLPQAYDLKEDLYILLQYLAAPPDSAQWKK